MPSTRAELVQTVKYHATSKTRSVEKIVSSITGEGCGPRQSINWNNRQLQVRNQIKLSFQLLINLIDYYYYLLW